MKKKGGKPNGQKCRRGGVQEPPTLGRLNRETCRPTKKGEKWGGVGGMKGKRWGGA